MDGVHSQSSIESTPDTGTAARARSSVRETPRTGVPRLPQMRGLMMSLLDATPGLVFVSDTGGNLVYMNALGRDTLGVDASDDLAGRNVAELYPEGGFDRILHEAVPVALDHGVWRGEAVLTGSGGTEIPVTQVLMAHQISRGGERQPMVALSSIAWDMRLHGRGVARLDGQATHDAVTGLPNRTLLLDRLRQAMRSARRHCHAVAVFFLEVEDLERIAAEHGHEAASAVLCELTHRLKSGLRAEDTVARYGADEFVLLVRDISAPIEPVRSRLVTAIYRALAAPFLVGDARVSPSVSVGAAVYPGDGPDAAVLLRKAGSTSRRFRRFVGGRWTDDDSRNRRAGDPQADSVA